MLGGKLAATRLQQQHRKNLFFEHTAMEQLVGHCDQVVDAFLAANYAAEPPRQFA
jgi:hypothetical protein